MTPNCTLRASSDTLRSPPFRVPGGRGYARPSPPHPPHPDQEIVESRWLMGNVKIEGPGTKRAGPTEEGPTGRPTGLRPAGGNLPPDPPPPYHDQFENTFLRIAKNRPDFFFYKFDTRPRRTSPGPTTKKKRVLSGLLFPLHREMCAARRRVRYINVPTCFGRNCPLFFLKLGEKKHPPSSFSLFFFPKIHTLMYGTITQYTYVRTRAGC